MKQQWLQASDKNINILSDYIPSSERKCFFRHFQLGKYICDALFLVVTSVHVFYIYGSVQR